MAVASLFDNQSDRGRLTLPAELIRGKISGSYWKSKEAHLSYLLVWNRVKKQITKRKKEKLEVF